MVARAAAYKTDDLDCRITVEIKGDVLEARNIAFHVVIWMMRRRAKKGSRGQVEQERLSSGPPPSPPLSKPPPLLLPPAKEPKQVPLEQVEAGETSKRQK